MKQIRLFFLFLTTIPLLQSCSNDEIEIQDPALKTTSVKIATYSSFLTGKNVNDPSLFGNINDIRITATHTASGYQASTLFTISNNTNDTSIYTVDEVQVGSNTFVASATSVNAPIPPGFTSIPTNNLNSAVWSKIDALVAGQPYAAYSGSLGATLIDVNNPTTLYIPMSTNNGRFIAYFRISTSKTNLGTKVTPYIDGTPQPPFSVTQAQDFYWIWNDSNCVDGKKIYFSCSTTNKGGGQAQLLTTPTITIKSHTTNKNTYDILGNGNSYAVIPRTP